MRKIVLPVFSVALALFISGCEEAGTPVPYIGGTAAYPTQPNGAPVDTISYWDGDAINGKPSVKISIGEQKAYFYKNGQLVGISQLSTGREGRATPPGHYSVIRKDRDHVSSQYGDFVDGGGQVVKPNVAVSDP